MEVTWDAVPAQEQTDTSAQAEQNADNSYKGMDPYDLFDYFFGSRYN